MRNLQNKIGKIIQLTNSVFSCTLKSIWGTDTYLQHLIQILKSNLFDHHSNSFALGEIIFAIESNPFVIFFMNRCLGVETRQGAYWSSINGVTSIFTLPIPCDPMPYKPHPLMGHNLWVTPFPKCSSLFKQRPLFQLSKKILR